MGKESEKVSELLERAKNSQEEVDALLHQVTKQVVKEMLKESSREPQEKAKTILHIADTLKVAYATAANLVHEVETEGLLILEKVDKETAEISEEARKSLQVKLTVATKEIISVKEFKELMRQMEEVLQKMVKETELVFDVTKTKEENVVIFLRPFQQVITLNKVLETMKRYYFQWASNSFLDTETTVAAWEYLTEKDRFQDFTDCLKLQDRLNGEIEVISRTAANKTLQLFGDEFCSEIVTEILKVLELDVKPIRERSRQTAEQYRKLLGEKKMDLSKVFSPNLCCIEYEATGFSIAFEEKDA